LVWDTPDSPHKASIPFVVNGVTQTWYEDKQEHQNRFCQHLDLTDGRCQIYADRPLPCRFELFKFVHYTSASIARAMVRLPGRGHALTRIDGNKGNECEIIPYDAGMTKSHAEDILVIGKWMDNFGIENDCAAVADWLLSGPHTMPWLRREL
jgi:hypothetical protein